MKKIFMIILAVFSLAPALMPAAAAESPGFMLDGANKLSDSTELTLTAQEVYDAANAAVCYASCESLNGLTAGEYLQQLYDEKIACDYGLLLLDCDELDKYSIYASPALRQYLDDAALEAMLRAYIEPQTYDESVAAYISAARDILLPLNLPAAAPHTAGGQSLPRVADNAGVLDAETLAGLNALADTLSGEYACDVSLVLVSSTDGRDIQDYSDAFYVDKACGYGADYSGILLTVAVSDHSFAVTAGGSGLRSFTDYGQQHMEKQYARALKRGDWAGAAKSYIAAAEELLKFERTNGRPYDAETAHRGFPPLALAACLALACAAAFVFRAQIKVFISRIKSRIKPKDRAD